MKYIFPLLLLVLSSCLKNKEAIIAAQHSCGAGNVHNASKTYGTVKDIDGNTYKTIQIGTQTWMAENLRTTRYRNGVSIENAVETTSWVNNTTGAYCSYNNNTANDCPYGKLYNWFAATNENGICPQGWHTPSSDEWSILINYLDPGALGGTNPNNTIAGGKMKSPGTKYWTGPNQGATNSTGFSGLPGGTRFNNGNFSDFKEYGYWWTSTPYVNRVAWFHFLRTRDGGAYKNGFDKFGGLCIRCIKD
jgi:uncharacterized protein (TIGR02145 family)